MKLKDSVKVNVLDQIQLHEKSLPKHKKNPAVGTKNTVFSSNLYLEFDDAKDLIEEEEITFMDWGNVIVKKVNWNSDKSALSSIDILLHLEGDFKKTKKKLTWLSDAKGLSVDRTPVNVLLLDYDYLITKKKLEEDDELQNFLTPVTEFKSFAIGDGNLRSLKKGKLYSFNPYLGDIIQFERKGYYICDKPYNHQDPEAEIQFILIPDGKVANTTSKANETKDSAKGNKQSSKGDKGAKSLVSKSKMYAMNSIYNESVRIDPAKVSKMYAMNNVYGDQLLNETPAQQDVKIDVAQIHKKEAKNGKPPKQETLLKEGTVFKLIISFINFETRYCSW